MPKWKKNLLPVGCSVLRVDATLFVRAFSKYLNFMASMEEKGHAFTGSQGEVFWFNPDHRIYLTGLRQLRV